MIHARYDAVPIAVPRWWFKDWLFSLWIIVFGHTLGTKQPFRWVLFRELSERERMAMYGQLIAEGKIQGAKKP